VYSCALVHAFTLSLHETAGTLVYAPSYRHALSAASARPTRL
jgi:hypothetical protein